MIILNLYRNTDLIFLTRIYIELPSTGDIIALNTVPNEEGDK